MAGPQMYETSSVSSTKGCSKQIVDLLTGGARLFLRWVSLNSVSLLRLSGLHGYLGTFPKGIGYFHCFLTLYSSACKKICETSPWLVAFERTCSYQFSLWETWKEKQIIHTGILDFWFLAAQFPQSVNDTANGSQTWFFSNADERQEKWVNFFKTAYFFGQGPSCRPTTHTNKSIYNGRSPHVWDIVGLVDKGLQ